MTTLTEKRKQALEVYVPKMAAWLKEVNQPVTHENVRRYFSHITCGRSLPSEKFIGMCVKALEANQT